MSGLSLPNAQSWQALGPHLDALLALPPRRRAGPLRGLRVEDPALAGDLADLLLVAERARAAGFLSGRADPDIAPRPEPLGDLVGRRIGAFTIESFLGSGGTASVWRARRAAVVGGEPVAVKLLRTTMPALAATAQVTRERSALARLDHANIVRLIGTHRTAAGPRCLVLEHVDGIAIERHCDAASLGVPERVTRVADLASALAHAHARAVIHCDVKASNVLVTAAGEVKLIDFGAACIDAHRLDGVACALRARSFTPAFAAPEQRRGEHVSEATDVHGLGVLLYGLVAGRAPFRAGAGADETAFRSGADEPVPLAHAWGDSLAEVDAMERAASRRGLALAEFRAVLEGGLQRVLAQAIARDPLRRHRSIAELASELEPFGHGPARRRSADGRSGSQA